MAASPLHNDRFEKFTIVFGSCKQLIVNDLCLGCEPLRNPFE